MFTVLTLFRGVHPVGGFAGKPPLEATEPHPAVPGELSTGRVRVDLVLPMGKSDPTPSNSTTI